MLKVGAGLDAIIAGSQEITMADAQYPSLSPIRTGLACRCPRCGKGRLFQGFLNLRPRCEACGLDYAFIDSGDGPAVFVILLAGFVVVACALIVEVKYQPPFWLHALLWGPLILATTLLPLRPMKGLMIALQFHHKAAEGRAEDAPR
jgi:uncharacterized protein (DUF983 family)